MGRRVNITDLARATHTSTSSWRTWMEQPGFPLTIEYGGYRGGTSEKRGRVRYLDFDEAVAWLNKRGGAQVEESVLPHEQLELLRAEITALNKRVQRLEELLLSGGYRPALASRTTPQGEQRSYLRDLPPLHTADASSDSDSDEDDDTLDPASSPSAPVPYHRPRRAAPASPKSRTSHNIISDREPFPSHLRTWRDVAEQHGIPESTMNKAIMSGRVPVVREPTGRGWKLPHGYAIEALDEEGIRIFHQSYARRFDLRPGEACRAKNCGYILEERPHLPDDA